MPEEKPWELGSRLSSNFHPICGDFSVDDPKFRPLFAALLATAAQHYEAGWRYTFEIPRAEWRMRVACAWPLLIGEATLAALGRHPNPLASAEPVKISRAAVRAIVARSSVAVWSNRALAAEAARVRGAAAD